MKGVHSNHGYLSNHRWNPRKKVKKNEKLLCLRCGKIEIKKGRQIYCGSYKQKTGCSYIEYRAMQNRCSLKFRKTHDMKKIYAKEDITNRHITTINI